MTVLPFYYNKDNESSLFAAYANMNFRCNNIKGDQARLFLFSDF